MSRTVNAGGGDMPPKTDIYDWTTPSGQMPMVLSGPAQWKWFQDEGVDMRFCVVARKIPVAK